MTSDHLSCLKNNSVLKWVNKYASTYLFRNYYESALNLISDNKNF